MEIYLLALLWGLSLFREAAQFDEKDFTRIDSVGSYSYIFSNSMVRFTRGEKECIEEGYFIPMFDTNEEFAAMFEYIRDNFNAKKVCVAIGILSMDDGTTSFTWQQETVDESLWATPNRCTDQGDGTCCGFTRISDDFKGSLKMEEDCESNECSILCRIPTDVTTLKEEDECKTGVDNCSHICTDMIVGYNCSCPSGLYLDASGYLCLDVDECESNVTSHGCPQLCVNEEGSYSCQCYAGYKDKGNNTCTDIDECDTTSFNLSSCDHLCVNSPGSYFCSCHPGYSLSNDDATCQDVDECNLDSVCKTPFNCASSEESDSYSNEGKNGIHNCAHICSNTQGSYSCSCKEGFGLAKDMRSCEDVDECTSNSTACSHICINTHGFYICSCFKGYGLESDGKTCADLDECDNSSLNACEQICSNTLGSFACSCYGGYTLAADQFHCEDIDECSSENKNETSCGQICVNTPGSYNCACGNGYKLDTNLTSCVKHVPKYQCPCLRTSKRQQVHGNSMNDTEAMRSELLVDKKKLSSFTRKRSSAEDNRESAQVIGHFPIVIFIILLALIIIPDVTYVIRFCLRRLR